MLFFKRLIFIVSLVICMLAFEKVYFALDFEIEEVEFDFKEVVAAAQQEAHSPKIVSPTAVAIDCTNGRVLYDKSAFVKRPMASTTKMMTAILAIEKGNLNDTVTVSRKAANVGGSQAYLKVGEKIKLEHLLYGLMLPSGNDAGVAVAEHIGGSVEEFIEMMDKKAIEIGALNTKYGSPHGLDRDNYSTAYDLALIASYCLKDPTFSDIVKSKTKLIPREGISGGTQYYNTNEMLDNYPGADGVKTGYTGPAGRCLVTSATRDKWQVVSVVLGATSRDNRSTDSSKILDYVFNNFPLVTILKNNQNMISIDVIKGKKEKVNIINKGEINVHLNDDELINIERKFIIPEQIIAPVKKDYFIGKVTLKLGKTNLGICELYTKENVEFWTVSMNFKKIFKRWFKIGELTKEYIKDILITD